MNRNRSNVVKSVVPYVPQAVAAIAPMVGNVGSVVNGTIRVINGVRYAYNTARNMWVATRRQGNSVVTAGARDGAVVAPIAVTRRISGNKPRFASSRGSVIITHREYVSQVTAINTGELKINNSVLSNTVFDLYRINPTNVALFPWLAVLAANFDQYKFVSLRLVYIPLCASTEVGRSALFFDKDSQDVGPSDRVELANFAHLSESAPWSEHVLDVPVDDVKRFNIDSSVSDPKLIDLGRIGLASYGNSTNNALGDVFVEYTVQLFEAQPASDIAQELTGNASSVVSNRGLNLFSFLSASSSNTVVSVRPKPGTYVFTFVADGTLITAAAPTVVTGGVVLSNKVVFTASEVAIVCTVDVSAPDSRLDFGTTSTTLATWNIFGVRATRSLVVSTIQG